MLRVIVYGLLSNVVLLAPKYNLIVVSDDIVPDAGVIELIPGALTLKVLYRPENAPILMVVVQL